MAIINKDGIVDFLQTHEAFDEKSKKFTKEFVEDFAAFITDALASGDTVSIAGFGKFEPYTSTTSGAVSPKFRPFKDLKDAVSKAA